VLLISQEGTWLKHSVTGDCFPEARNNGVAELTVGISQDRERSRATTLHHVEGVVRKASV